MRHFLLLWRSENPSPLIRGLLRSYKCSTLHQTIPLWWSSRRSSWCLPFFLSTMSHDTIFLSNSQVNQLIISVYLDGVQMIFELSIHASSEVITLLSISISMITHVMREVIECLSILENSACPLSKVQKLIQFSFHKPFRNMMGSECILEFIPGDNVIHREHIIAMIPP